MKKEVYGCACCSPEFGKIFTGNKKVAELSTLNPSDIILNMGEKLWMDKLDRRTFLKGSLVAGTVALLPGLTGCTESQKEETTVFRGGTVGIGGGLVPSSVGPPICPNRSFVKVTSPITGTLGFKHHRQTRSGGH